VADVPFATTCDVATVKAEAAKTNGLRISGPCGARSLEYTSWPRCRMCNDYCCPAHHTPGTVIDEDLDSPATCICLACTEAGEEED
jgi:hypothetical protein